INHTCLPMNVWLRVQIRGPPPKLPSVVRFELVEEAWAAISEGDRREPPRAPDGFAEDVQVLEETALSRANDIDFISKRAQHRGKPWGQGLSTEQAQGRVPRAGGERAALVISSQVYGRKCNVYEKADVNRGHGALRAAAERIQSGRRCFPQMEAAIRIDGQIRQKPDTANGQTLHVLKPIWENKQPDKSEQLTTCC
ncbi:hypothetical protein MG293_008001, partial [Ovis ammon polii]